MEIQKDKEIPTGNKNIKDLIPLMEKGDSFIYSKDTARRYYSTAYNIVRYYNIKFPTTKFKLFKTVDGLKIFRLQ